MGKYMLFNERIETMIRPKFTSILFSNMDEMAPTQLTHAIHR